MQLLTHEMESRFFLESLFVVFGFVMFAVYVQIKHFIVTSFCVTGTQITQIKKPKTYNLPAALFWAMGKAGN